MLHEIMKITFCIFSGYCVYCLIRYLPRMGAWFGSFKKQQRLENDEKSRFAIIVPARNESSVIGELFASLERQTYKNFDTYVIVKDYNDKSIDLAKKAGAIPLVLRDQNCKGDALDYALKTILKGKENYDSCFIIDADCYMADNCLFELNNAMKSGKQVIQARRKVKNFYIKSKKANSLVSSCNGLIWNIIDDLGNRYKSDHNITGMLIGTGIMIRMDVVKELGGWPYKQTLTEDIEFMNDCAIRGISTFYYSYAEIFLEESTKLRVTNKRRERWMNGVINSKRIYNERLKTVNKKDRYFVTGLSPIFHLVGACTIYALMNLVAFIVMFFTDNLTWQFCLQLSLLSLSIIYFLFFVLTIFILLAGRIKRPWYEQIILLFVHPLFYMGYIPIIIKIYLGLSANKWEVIDRVNFEAYK